MKISSVLTEKQAERNSLPLLATIAKTSSLIRMEVSSDVRNRVSSAIRCNIVLSKIHISTI